MAKIEGQSEHILNRKPRINGVIVDGNKRLELQKEYTIPEIRRKVRNVFNVQKAIINRENSDVATDNTLSFANTGKSFTMTITKGGATEDFVMNFLKINRAKNAFLKRKLIDAMTILNSL